MFSLFMHELLNRQTGAALFCVFVCSTLAWLLLGTPLSGVEEADLFLVHARNFVNGNGFVFHIGSQPFEGVFSLLWLWVCSFVYMLTYTAEAPLFLLNLLFGIITVYVCLQRCTQKPAFLLLLCSAPAWFAWCQLALEDSGLWCLLLTLSVLAVSERRTSQAVWMLPLLVLNRPEAILWSCWLLVVLFLGLGLDRGWRVAMRAVFRPLLVFGIVWAAMVRFWIRHSDVLVLRGSGSSASHGLEVDLGAGIFYMLGYLFSNPAVLLVVLVFGWACAREIARKRGLSRPLTVGLCLLPALGFPLLAADDHFRAFRFYQPLWPLLCLVSAWAMPLLYGRLSRFWRRLSPIALFAAAWMIFALSGSLREDFSRAHKGREQGAVLERMFAKHEQPPGVAVMTAGPVRYTYSGEVYDLAGLAVAERGFVSGGEGTATKRIPFDPEIFQGWQPDILIENYSGSVEKAVIDGLLSERKFREHYVKGELWYNSQIFFAYFSRDFINGLEDGHYVFNQDLQYALEMEERADSFIELPAGVSGGTGDHWNAAQSILSYPVRW